MGEHSRNIFFDKVNKAHLINKMKLEEHNILDGRTWYHIKYDNTAPKTAFLFTYLPYNMDRAWTYEGGRQHTANGGFTLTHKITHGENVIQEGEMVFDVKANDGSKFEMEHLHKMTMTEESPFYGMVYWYTGRYAKNVERKMTVFFDKINKSILFVPKMKMDTVMTVDGEKTSEFVFDNTQAKKHIKFFYSPDTYTKDYLYEEEWEYPGNSGIKCKIDFKRGGVSTYNYDGEYSWVNNGNKFEVKSNEKVKQEQNGPYYGVDHWFVGTYWKDAVVTRTFTYEKKNRNFLLGKIFFESKVVADGERFYEAKLDTKFGWEWAGVKKVYLDVVGNNPWIGDYKLSRKGEFEEVSGSLYKIKWTGHGETTKGFLRRVSPVETNVVASLNTRNLKVDAIVWKSFAGKKYGFTMNNDKFTLLAGKH